MTTAHVRYIAVTPRVRAERARVGVVRLHVSTDARTDIPLATRQAHGNRCCADARNSRTAEARAVPDRRTGARVQSDRAPDRPGVTSPPLLVLGVRRSGTTLLRVMLDRRLAARGPGRVVLHPQLAQPARRPTDVDAFVDDLRRLPTLREWELPPRYVVRCGRALRSAKRCAIYETYAEQHGKDAWATRRRCTCSTWAARAPVPDAQLRPPDSRRPGHRAVVPLDAAGIVTESWHHPRDAAGFACQWRTEVGRRRRRSAAGPAPTLPRAALRGARPGARGQAPRGSPRSPGCGSSAAMLKVRRQRRFSAKPHQQSLGKAPTPGLRDWRTAMSRRRACVRRGGRGSPRAAWLRS